MTFPDRLVFKFGSTPSSGTLLLFTLRGMPNKKIKPFCQRYVHNVSTYLPSAEWLNEAEARLSQTCALCEVRFSCMSSNFLIHFGLYFAVKSPSCNIKQLVLQIITVSDNFLINSAHARCRIGLNHLQIHTTHIRWGPLVWYHQSQA